ncbi:MAG: hypothetical protein ACI9PZ_002368 [Parvicella sp.]
MNTLKKIGLGSPRECRELIRNNLYHESTTSGMAPGFIQGNVVILPESYALDFMQYCLNNPKSCPLLGISNAGSRSLDCLGNGIDITLDMPKYRVNQRNQSMQELNNMVDIWRDDLVTFILGCSFSFEHALQAAGYPIRHIDLQQNVPMFDTNIDTIPGGIFNGQLVVTMRPIKKEFLNDVYSICSNYPFAHGTPIHAGDPASIGISDLNKPQYGEAPDIKEGEIPVFWACGVTTQVALMNAKPDFYVTHSPGHMLITDLSNTADIDPVRVSVDFYQAQIQKNK